MVSEEKMFENVDVRTDGRTPDSRIDWYIITALTYEPSAQMSYKHK